jgi:hypothetical protein
VDELVRGLCGNRAVEAQLTCSISRERAFGFIILRIRMLCDSGELRIWRGH